MAVSKISASTGLDGGGWWIYPVDLIWSVMRMPLLARLADL